MILIYYILMFCITYTSKEGKKKRKIESELQEKKLPDECIVCYERFPVLLKFPCFHELCALCVEKIINICDNYNCPKCRTPLPDSLTEFRAMIYPIQLTLDISLEKLQHVFPIICSTGNLATVTKCIKMGVDENKIGLFGNFPLHLASQKNVVKYLVNKGAYVNQANSNGASPLVISSEAGYLPIVKYLLKNGATVNQSCNDGTTSLFMSVQNGHLRVVKYLIKNGANVNQVTKNHRTPLAVAIYNNHIKVAKLLLSKNANMETTKLVLENNGLLHLIGILDKLCNQILRTK